MKGIFSSDSIIGRALNKIGELVILSILWFFTSLPVITIGVSTTALYYATVKSLRMERGYFIKEYFKAWKENFLRSTALTVFFIVCLLGLWTALQMMGIELNDLSVEAIRNVRLDNKSAALGIYFVAAGILILLGALFCYVFPLASRFDQSGLKTLLMSFVMMIRFFYYSIAVLVILVGLVYMVIRLPLGIMFAPGLWALLSSFLLEKAFKKYTPEPDPDSDVDAWWMRLG